MKTADAIEKLIKLSIPFRQNSEHHLTVYRTTGNGAITVDLWPTTEKWRGVNYRINGIGFYAMLDALEIPKEEQLKVR